MVDSAGQFNPFDVGKEEARRLLPADLPWGEEMISET